MGHLALSQGADFAVVCWLFPPYPVPSLYSLSSLPSKTQARDQRGTSQVIKSTFVMPVAKLGF